jgi:hypothetical protein
VAESLQAKHKGGGLGERGGTAVAKPGGLRDSSLHSVAPGPRRGWWRGSGRRTAHCGQRRHRPQSARVKLALTLEARESQWLTFELRGERRHGAWPAGRMLYHTGRRAKCHAGASPLERRVRPHFG